MKVLIDTNFIMTCIKHNIDIAVRIQDCTSETIEWIVPQQVLNELGNLKDTKTNKKADKDRAALAFPILKDLHPTIIDLGRNPNIDIGIVNYCLDKEIVIATCDHGLKERLPHKQILTVQGKKRLAIERQRPQ